MEDLEGSVWQAQETVNLIPQGHLDMATMLSNLGNKLESRFERTGKMEDLEESIQRAQMAVDITPQDQPNLARRKYHVPEAI
jgi:hypothetical protein